jgi:hypothetical protein
MMYVVTAWMSKVQVEPESNLDRPVEAIATMRYPRALVVLSFFKREKSERFHKFQEICKFL